jgi:4-diphosphocytidyl-2-C-methyl-D-erythritol kinase
VGTAVLSDVDDWVPRNKNGRTPPGPEGSNGNPALLCAAGRPGRSWLAQYVREEMSRVGARSLFLSREPGFFVRLLCCIMSLYSIILAGILFRRIDVNRLRLLARGKINLALDVLRRRPDGYHEVSMVMQTISIGDGILLEDTQDERVSLTISDPTLGTGPENLGYRTAALLREKYRIRQGVRIHIEKNIPVAAGLGGGSADAAGVLVGLNKLWNLGLSDEALAEMALGIGADVPFCLKGGTALAEGIGEKLTTLPTLPECRIALVKPPFPVSTAEVYKGWDNLANPLHPDTAGVVRLIRAGDFQRLPQYWGNALETVTFQLRPEVERLFVKLQNLGYNLRMSGSGPTLFIWDLPNNSAASWVVDQCREWGVWAEALWTYGEGITFYS